MKIHLVHYDPVGDFFASACPAVFVTLKGRESDERDIIYEGVVNRHVHRFDRREVTCGHCRRVLRRRLEVLRVQLGEASS